MKAVLRIFVFFVYDVSTYYPRLHWICVTGEVVSNHDELMSNFFAQPDALAFGKVRWIIFLNLFKTFNIT